MKKMIESMIIAGCMLVALLYMTACSDKLDVQQMYEFDLATLPVQTTIVKGEEAEIRCQLVRSGEYQDTKYFIRYFQPTGKGELRMENGTVLLPERPVSVTGRNIQALLQVIWHRPAENRHLHS